MPAVVIGGITYPLGGWMLAAAVAVVLGAVLVVRFRYRRGLESGQGAALAAADAPGGSHRRRRR